DDLAYVGAARNDGGEHHLFVDAAYDDATLAAEHHVQKQGAQVHLPHRHVAGREHFRRHGGKLVVVFARFERGDKNQPVGTYDARTLDFGGVANQLLKAALKDVEVKRCHVDSRLISH